MQRRNDHEACKTCSKMSCPYIELEQSIAHRLCLDIAYHVIDQKAQQEVVKYERENPTDPEFFKIYTYEELTLIARNPDINPAIRNQIKICLLKSSIEISVYYDGDKHKATFYLWRDTSTYRHKNNYSCKLISPDEPVDFPRAKKYSDFQDETSTEDILTGVVSDISVQAVNIPYSKVLKIASDSSTPDHISAQYFKVLGHARSMSERAGIPITLFAKFSTTENGELTFDYPIEYNPRAKSWELKEELRTNFHVRKFKGKYVTHLSKELCIEALIQIRKGNNQGFEFDIDNS